MENDTGLEDFYCLLTIIRKNLLENIKAKQSKIRGADLTNIPSERR